MQVPVHPPSQGSGNLTMKLLVPVNKRNLQNGLYLVTYLMAYKTFSKHPSDTTLSQRLLRFYHIMLGLGLSNKISLCSTLSDFTDFNLLWHCPEPLFGYFTHFYKFTFFALSAGFQLRINQYWKKTGNQNHPDLEVRVVLVTCISNIDFW